MCDKELLVSYVYDELPGAERKAFQHHLASCRDCQAEVQGLRATRTYLAAWTPPDHRVGFQLTGDARVAAPARFRLSPAWGLAAAAVLVLAAAAAVANVDVTVGADGLRVRTGWRQPADTAAPIASADGASREALTTLELRVQELESALAAQPAATPTSLSATPASAVARMSDAELLRRVRQWIAESEQRQDQQLAARLVQGMRELQAAHAVDLARLEQTINRNQGAFSDEIVRQREVMNQFYRLVNSQQR
jgi:hypothetical protein